MLQRSWASATSPTTGGQGHPHLRRRGRGPQASTGVALDAFWLAPGVEPTTSRLILDVLKRHEVKAQLWVLLDVGEGPRLEGPGEQRRRVEAAASELKPLAEEAAKAGCSLALYNHGGWFGEPENQVAIIEGLKKQGSTNVGMVYNLHHGHEHTGFASAEPQALAMPYLKAVNLNGMDPGPTRAPEDPPAWARLARPRPAPDDPRLGYKGPIGILGHTRTTPRPGSRTTSTASTGSSRNSTASPRPSADPRTPVAPPARLEGGGRPRRPLDRRRPPGRGPGPLGDPAGGPRSSPRPGSPA